MAEQIVDLMEANMPVSSDAAAVARSAGGAAGEEAGRRAASVVVGDVSDRVDVVSARVDGLVASGDGDGGDVGAELRDVRVEWTGGTAGTAGGAVRAQFEDLDSRALKIPAGEDGLINWDDAVQAPWDDLDTFPRRTLMVVNNSGVAHRPGTGTWFVLTLGPDYHDDSLMKMQVAYDLTGNAYVRSINGSAGSQWTEWVRAGGDASLESRALKIPAGEDGLINYDDAVQAPWDDLDTFPRRTLMVVNNSGVAHRPGTGTWYVLTLGPDYHDDSLMKMQVVYDLNGNAYTRSINAAPGNQWTGWVKVVGGVSAGEYADFGIFNRIACLGDSYTAGAVATSGGAYLPTAGNGRPWPSVVADRCQVTADNYGIGGSTTKSYWTGNLSKVLDGEPADGYFYCWGINDASTADNFVALWDGLAPMDHLGTPDDIVADADATPANTFYGYYSSIIRKCQAHAPKALHTLIAMPTIHPDTTENRAYIEATITLADRMGLPCMDPRDDPFFRSATYRAMHSGHPTRQGYIGMAKAYTRLFGECVERNASYYTNAVIG